MSETTYTKTPIPLRLLFAAHPDLLAPVLQIIHRVIATFLIQQAGLQRTEAHPGAVTLIQRFGSAANLNIHLHCLVRSLSRHRGRTGVPCPAPKRALRACLETIIRSYKRTVEIPENVVLFPKRMVH